MDMVRGREISRYYEQSDLACTHILSAMLILSEMPEFNELKGTIKTQITDKFFLNMLQYLRQNLRNIYKKIIILNRKKSSHILWHLTVWIELLNTEMVIR